jgi:hypothetical protein
MVRQWCEKKKNAINFAPKPDKMMRSSSVAVGVMLSNADKWRLLKGLGELKRQLCVTPAEFALVWWTDLVFE